MDVVGVPVFGGGGILVFESERGGVEGREEGPLVVAGASAKSVATPRCKQPPNMRILACPATTPTASIYPQLSPSSHTHTHREGEGEGGRHGKMNLLQPMMLTICWPLAGTCLRPCVSA